MTTSTQATSVAWDDYDLLARSFRRALVAENKSPHTIGSHLASINQFRAFFAAQGMPLVVAAISREHCQEWITALLGTHISKSVVTRFRALARGSATAIGDGAHPSQITYFDRCT